MYICESTKRERVCLIDENDYESLIKLFKLVDSENSSDSELLELYGYDNICHILQIYYDENFGIVHTVIVYNVIGYGWVDERLSDPNDKVWSTKLRLASELNKEVRYYR